MDYWSARRALARVLRFRDEYVRFVNARLKGDSAEAVGAQTEMARLGMAVQRDLNRIGGIGYFILRDAPALGGTEHPTELVLLARNWELHTLYHVDPTQVVLNIETVIGEYDRLSHLGFRNLFNPLWWLRELLAFVVRIPFYILGVAGINEDAAEASLVGRLYKLVATPLAAGAFLLGVYANLYQLGWADGVRRAASLVGITLP